MGATDPVGVVRSYLDAFARGDADAIAVHVAADFANDHRSTLGVSGRGRDEYRRRPVPPRHRTRCGAGELPDDPPSPRAAP